MAQALFYSSNAVAMTLGAGIASGDTTCNLSSASGLPASFPFKLLIGWGTGQQEVVHCTALAGTVATIARGQDGTTAQSHSIGSSVVHGVSAREFNDLELHIASTAAVHGITGSFVGTTDTQTLTNKTLASPTITGSTALHGFDSANPGVIRTALDSDIGLIIHPANSTQSGDLQQWQANTGIAIAVVKADGEIDVAAGAHLGGSSSVTNGPVILAQAQSATARGLVVQGAASQSADLQQWQNNSGTPLAKVDAAGNISAANFPATWTAYTPTFTNCTSPVGTFRYLLMGKTLFLRGNFSSGTATAAASISFTLPAGLTGQANGNQLVPATVANAFSQFIVNTGLTTVGSTASLSAGQALSGITLNGAIEVA